MPLSLEELIGKQICIYCMGEYGLKTYFKLRSKGVFAICFGDSDIRKSGYALEGVYCYSYDEVKRLDKKETIVIVSIKKPRSLIEQFKNLGFKYVYSYENIDFLIERDPEIKENRSNILSERELRNLYANLASAYYERSINKEDITNKDAMSLLDDCLKRQEDIKLESS